MTKLDGYSSLQFKVEVNFSDTVAQEFVQILMAAGLTLRTTFHAKFFGSNRVLELGSVVLETAPGRLHYQPILAIENSVALGLAGDKAYQIGATVRVGTSPFCIPSLMRGTIEGGVLNDQAGILVTKTQAVAIASADPDQAIAAAKTPRRRVVKK